INTPMQFVGDNTFFINDAFSSLLKYIKSIEELSQKVSSGNPDILAEFAQLKNDYDIDFLTEEIPVAIDRTQNGIQRVSKIVLAMKNFAHPSSKQKTLSDINQGVDVTLTISRNEWKYVAELETRLDPNLPLVHCTIDEINQVILNMLVNAAHAIEEAVGRDSGKLGKITIETKSDGDFVYIIIQDNGRGIPQEIQSRIFDPFFTTKEVGKGTGQGLAIAHDIIVNKHNGEISIDSEIGMGTTFTLKLPIHSKQDSLKGEK
ncbi:MAG: ATP-binding protein, partial [Bacteroidetes bacterium]|nr:ATP-binding protein [Bacteroidota bacterium]